MLKMVRQPAVLNQPVVDPAAWTAEDLDADQGWIHPLTESDIAELDAAVARVEERGLDIMDITRDDFVLPTLGDRLDEIAADVVHGRGLALIRGVPVDRYSRVQSAIAFWGTGLFLGLPCHRTPRDTSWATWPISAAPFRTRSTAATRPTTCCRFTAIPATWWC